MKYGCQYCHKEFASKQSLLRHQQTNVSCLKLRNKEKVTEMCEYCKKEYIHLSIHQKTCKRKSFFLDHEDKIEKMQEKLTKKSSKMKMVVEENRKLKRKLNDSEKTNTKLKEENSLMRDKILELEGTITGLKTAPDKKTIYNTAIHPKLVNLPINNIPPLTHEYVMEKVNDGILTYEKAAKGYLGILDVICDLITHENEDGVIERNYVCTDVSRNSFHRLLESKKWKSDKGGRYLNTLLNSFQNVMEEYKEKVYGEYEKTPHDSIQWGQVEWERKNISQLYCGIVCKEGTKGREELVNILRKEISKRASV